jgi:hypothetical protein
MVELKLVGEILLILFFVIIVILLVNLIIPKGAKTISILTGGYVEYVENLTRGCKEGEIKNECLSCGKYGFEPNHTICEEKKGKNFFCGDDGYCKEFECPPPCDPRYEICEDKNRCHELKPNACYYMKDCYIYLIPPEDETTENYAGYIHLKKDGKAYAIIPCYKTEKKYICNAKKEILELGQCYTGDIYWQTGFISIPKPEDAKPLICAVNRPEAKNYREIKITYADYKDWIEKFECEDYVPHCTCPIPPPIPCIGPCWDGFNGTKCKIKFKEEKFEEIKDGIIYLQGRTSDKGETFTTFLSVINSKKIDGKEIEIIFSGFDRFAQETANFSFLIYKDTELQFVSLPLIESISKVDYAKKDEQCWAFVGINIWNKPCAINETTNQQYECVNDCCTPFVNWPCFCGVCK